MSSACVWLSEVVHHRDTGGVKGLQPYFSGHMVVRFGMLPQPHFGGHMVAIGLGCYHTLILLAMWWLGLECYHSLILVATWWVSLGCFHRLILLAMWWLSLGCYKPRRQRAWTCVFIQSLYCVAFLPKTQLGVREKSQTHECIFCLYVVETVAVLPQNWFYSLLSSWMHQNIVQFCPAKRLVWYLKLVERTLTCSLQCIF